MAPPGSATFRGVDLAGQPFGSVLVSMLTLDPGLEVDADGFTSLDLGLGVFAPGHEEEPDLPIEGVIAFRDGYYDR